jgi:E3 ubiquitin-protein ligase UBR4
MYIPGLAHVDATVGALVEIIHAFTVNDLDTVTLASKLYIRMLLSQVCMLATQGG